MRCETLRPVRKSETAVSSSRQTPIKSRNVVAHTGEKIRSRRPQQRVQNGFVDLGGTEICREGRDSRPAACRYLRAVAGGMQAKRGVGRCMFEIKRSRDRGRLTQLIDCVAGGQTCVLVEPFRHHQFGSRAGAALSIHLDCNVDKNLRRFIHGHRAEPERVTERHAPLGKVDAFHSDTWRHGRSIEVAVGEVRANCLGQPYKGRIGQDVERTRPPQRHFIDSGDIAGPRRHDQHTVSQKHRLRNGMCNKQYGLFCFALNALQFDIHALARHCIERTKGLVHQHDLGIVNERAADRGALLHAAGQLPWILVFEVLQADQL